MERNLGEVERRRGSHNADDVRVVVGVGRENHRDHLRLAPEAGGKERPDRAVNHPAGEDFLFRRPSFALDEAAGNPPRGVGIFAVIHGEREETDSFARVLIGGGRDQHYGVAVAHQDRAAGLLCETPGFERQILFSDLNAFLMNHRSSKNLLPDSGPAEWLCDAASGRSDCLPLGQSGLQPARGGTPIAAGLGL